MTVNVGNIVTLVSVGFHLPVTSEGLEGWCLEEGLVSYAPTWQESNEIGMPRFRFIRIGIPPDRGKLQHHFNVLDMRTMDFFLAAPFDVKKIDWNPILRQLREALEHVASTREFAPAGAVPSPLVLL